MNTSVAGFHLRTDHHGPTGTDEYYAVRPGIKKRYYLATKIKKLAEARAKMLAYFSIFPGWLKRAYPGLYKSWTIKRRWRHGWTLHPIQGPRPS